MPAPEADSPLPPSPDPAPPPHPRAVAPSEESLASASNLTRGQLLIWLGQQFAGDRPLYNMALVFRLPPEVDAARLLRAWDSVVRGTDALRIVVELTDGVPIQRVLAEPTSEPSILDLSAAADAETALRSWAEQRARQAFDLSRSLVDAVVVRLPGDRLAWYLGQHHLITDAWSVALLFRRLADAYHAHDASEAGAPHPAYPDFATCAARERDQRLAPAVRDARAHWDGQIARATPHLPFYGRSATRTGLRSARLTVGLGTARTARLRRLAAEPGIAALTPDLTLFQIFLAALAAWTRRVTDTVPLVLGAPTHHRASAALKRTVGLFIEVHPIALGGQPGDTLADLYRTVATAMPHFLRHALPGSSTAAHNQAYPVLLNFLTASVGSWNGHPVGVEWIHPGHGDEGHALRLQVHDLAGTGEFTLHFDVNETVFPADLRPLVPRQFLAVLDAFLVDRTRPISEIPLDDPAQRRWLVHTVNHTEVPLAPQATLLDWWQAEVRRRPEAEVYLERGRGRRGTVADLDRAARRVTRRLRDSGVGPGDLVGVCCRRTPELLAGILGTLAAGAAFVPLDPAHPAARLDQLAQDAGLRAVLTCRDLRDRAPEVAVMLDLDAPPEDSSTPAAPPDPGVAPRPDSLAYVIFTSGSTGTPKGVMVEHGSLLNYLAWAARSYVPRDGLAFPLFSSIAFDLTLTTIFLPLLAGGRVVLHPESGSGTDLSILEVAEDDAVDVVKLTPSHLALLVGHLRPGSRLRTLIVGGEDLRTDLAAKATAAIAPDLAIYNEYGPTEATVGCMIHRYDPAVDRSASVSIGVPAANTRIYVLDPAGRLVPTGLPGEIHIGGAGVARGYWNRPDLTAERFLADPFVPGGRLYRTGDLARWTAAGRLDFLGRADGQVKIRGVRVEPAEIERALCAHPAIRECVVSVVAGAGPESDREPAPAEASAVRHCRTCGLPSNHPQAHLDASGRCRLCLLHDERRAMVRRYFKSRDELRAVFDRARSRRRGDYDCLVLFSGGKDSSYMLYQVVEMGLKVLTFTLDNGYISDEAKANIRRIVDGLGVDHVFGSTPHMREIFADSLRRFSNVCNGCFKTIYTLALELAHRRGIPCIVTGLSRGQFFETRVAELFQNGVFDPDAIDRQILEARKAYHRMPDAVARLHDGRLFADDRLFDDIEFVDFYRYCEVTLEEVYAFLRTRAPWIRPSDTGRSTNCLINDVGIHVHRLERGHHNYALPYSWDVILGHKDRTAALQELDDAIDLDRVHRILDELGYVPRSRHRTVSGPRLAAYYAADRELPPPELRAHLAGRLPDAFVPAFFVRLERLPLTPNGKVDHRALPAPDAASAHAPEPAGQPGTDLERRLVELWQEVLARQPIGILDNFFDLGGDSILCLQLVSRAARDGIRFTLQQVFERQTIAALATVATVATVAAASPAASAPDSPTPGAADSGPLPLAPAQQRFLERCGHRIPAHSCQVLLLEPLQSPERDALADAWRKVLDRHPVLRTRFERDRDGGWTPSLPTTPSAEVEVTLESIPASLADPAAAAALLTSTLSPHLGRLDPSTGDLTRVFLLPRPAGAPPLVAVAIHHLVVDAFSWRPLLADFASAWKARETPPSGSPAVSVATTPGATFDAWCRQLAHRTRAGEFDHERPFWEAQHAALRAAGLPATSASLTHGRRSRHTQILDRDLSRLLAQELPARAGVPLQDYLLAALARALSRITASARIIVEIESHGRSGTGPLADLGPAIGWFTAAFPLALDLRPGGDPPEHLDAVRQALRKVPGEGLGYAALCSFPGPGRHRLEPPAGMLPTVRFNHLGHLIPSAAAPAGYPFRVATPLQWSRSDDHPAGPELEVNLGFHEDLLRVEWSWGDPVWDHTTRERLAPEFAGQIAALADSSRTRNAPTPTAADFPLAGLDDRQLGRLAEKLRRLG